jgi:hypothetical protein
MTSQPAAPFETLKKGAYYEIDSTNYNKRDLPFSAIYGACNAAAQLLSHI